MAVATDILAAVKAIVEQEFAGKKCFTRRASDKNPALWADMTFPCFSFSLNDDRKTEMAWAGKKFVRYVGELAYLTKELPGQREPSTDVEDVLDRASKKFLASRDAGGKPGLEGVPHWNDAEVTPMAPYSLPFGSQTVSASRLRLEIETLEDSN